VRLLLCVHRKIKNESATGSTSSQRVTTTLTVEVENIDYDSVASVLHLKGKNVEENQHVKVWITDRARVYIIFSWARITRSISHCNSSSH
jgi:stalled ribosome rescue protein Dom34